MSERFDEGTVVEKQASRVKPPPMYQVVLLNDDGAFIKPLTHLAAFYSNRPPETGYKKRTNHTVNQYANCRFQACRKRTAERKTTRKKRCRSRHNSTSFNS